MMLLARLLWWCLYNVSYSLEHVKAPSNQFVIVSYGSCMSSVSLCVKNFFFGWQNPFFRCMIRFILFWIVSIILYAFVSCMSYNLIRFMIPWIISYMNLVKIPWFISLFFSGLVFCLVGSNHSSLIRINLHMGHIDSIQHCLIRFNLHSPDLSIFTCLNRIIH